MSGASGFGLSDSVRLVDIPTVESIRARRLVEDAALADMEKKRRASDRVIAITDVPNGMMALTEQGRLFFRSLDSRNFDGRNPQKYIWTEVEGPLG